MTIDETSSILRIILENKGDIPTNYSYLSNFIALTKQPICQLIAMIQPFISMVIFASFRIYIFMKINKNIRIKRKIAENEWGIPTKLRISELLIALE